LPLTRPNRKREIVTKQVSETARRQQAYRERKAALGKCAFGGCWDDAVGLYCPRHSQRDQRKAKKRRRPA
jgi:hypothetical protein